MEDTRPAIKVQNIVKSFRIPLDGRTGVKQKVLNIFRRTKGYRIFTPLNNISFEVNKGEFFGIVGRNGSGKSTLLKLMAGIYTPDKGSVNVNGSLIPFIELGVGFNPELTGRENVYLNGALLGFSRDEITAMYEEIVDFAELNDFMEEQLKNYSSGMQVRLAFSIAVRAKGNILLLDEVLAVGDSNFQQKCFDYFEQIKKENRTIILVTHNMDIVRRFCTRALLLEEGRITFVGAPDKVVDKYILSTLSPSTKKKSKDDPKSSKPAATSTSLINGSVSAKEVTRSEDLVLSVTYKLDTPIDPVLGVAIVKDGRSVAELNSVDTQLTNHTNKENSAHLPINLENFTQGVYSVNIALFKRETMEMIEFKANVATFLIKGDDQTRGGAVYLKGPWKADQ